MDVIKPMTYIQMDFLLGFKTSNKNLFNISFEYCKSYGNFPIILKIIFDQFKQFANNLIHSCPYEPQKRLGLENFPANKITSMVLEQLNKIIKVYQGDYTAEMYITDKKGKLIFFFKCTVSVVPKRVQRKGNKL